MLDDTSLFGSTFAVLVLKSRKWPQQGSQRHMQRLTNFPGNIATSRPPLGSWVKGLPRKQLVSAGHRSLSLDQRIAHMIGAISFCRVLVFRYTEPAAIVRACMASANSIMSGGGALVGSSDVRNSSSSRKEGGMAQEFTYFS